VKYFLELSPPGRRISVFPDDVFLVSYPKSGNTWLRFLVANLMYPEKNVDFLNLENLVPGIEGGRKRDFKRMRRPRIMKSQEYFDHRYPKLIYLVRDPRDVVLAEYYYDIKRRAIAEDTPLEQFVACFLSGQLNHAFGTWGEHVASWLSTRGDDRRLLLLKYEALHKQPLEEMARIAAFLGVEAGPERLEFAIEQSKADRLRQLEKKQGHLFSSTRDTRQDMPYIRSAKSGGWKTQLSEASIAKIESRWGGLMKQLGYESTVPESGTLPQIRRPSPPFGEALTVR
jgi:hypothetical protein